MAECSIESMDDAHQFVVGWAHRCGQRVKRMEKRRAMR